MAQHLEGLGRLLELGDRLFIARIAVRVIFQGQFAIGLGDLAVAGGAIDPEHFIIVAFFGHRRHIRSLARLPRG